MRIAVVVLLAAMTGCGSETTAAAPAAETTPPARPAGTELTVVVKPRPERPGVTYTLTCNPAGGDHPDPEAACEALAELDDPFAPVRSDAVCTEIYGGPQTATVAGTWNGDPVIANFSRTNGCEIARWDAHVQLLVEAGGAEGT